MQNIVIEYSTDEGTVVICSRYESSEQCLADFHQKLNNARLEFLAKTSNGIFSFCDYDFDIFDYIIKFDKDGVVGWKLPDVYELNEWHEYKCRRRKNMLAENSSANSN